MIYREPYLTFRVKCELAQLDADARVRKRGMEVVRIQSLPDPGEQSWLK